MTIRPQSPPEELLLTQDLLQRAKTGDHHALGVLIARYRPRLERWATGRLPGHARSLFDTGDLIQEVLMRALENLDRIEIHGPGMFQAYMRQAILNRIRDQLRTSRARSAVALSDQIEAKVTSPLESAIGAELLDRYERAFERLSEEERRLLHLRLELDLSYVEIGAIMERTPDSARMASQRALTKLAKIMGHEP
jgi:RNA polymerase sigma factor (sigma-70 family)